MVTSLTFSGSTDGDFVAFQTTDCVGAHTVASSVNSLTQTALSGGSVSTLTLMTDTTQLIACYATSEAVSAAGASQYDFSQLSVSLTQVIAVTFEPQRIVQNAQQSIQVDGGVNGDSVAWSSTPDCSAIGSTTTTNTTQSYPIISSSSAVVLGSMLEPGTYKLCYQPTAAGVWTHVTGNDLTIIAKPTFTPVTAVAG